jgi:hypothetical protein
VHRSVYDWFRLRLLLVSGLQRHRERAQDKHQPGPANDAGLLYSSDLPGTVVVVVVLLFLLLLLLLRAQDS